MEKLGCVSSSVNVSEWRLLCSKLVKEADKCIRKTNIGASADTDVSMFRSTTVQREINDAFEAEVQKIREEMPHEHAHKTRRPRPDVLRNKIDFDQIPTLQDIIERNKQTGLKSFEDGSREKIEALFPPLEPSALPSRIPDVDGFEAVGNDETVLSVSVLHPCKSLISEEFLVLGSQRLTVLRDAIYCGSDNIVDGTGKESAFFFIGDIFYNDMRHEDAIDYSDPIIRWAKTSERWNRNGFPTNLDKKSMDSVTFNDLELRIGAQYLYCHRGDCEHLLVFKEVRLFHPNDEKNKLQYPLRTFKSKARRRRCRVCDQYSSRFVCYGDELADEEPMFCCEKCYSAVHYSSDGRLKYSFESFPYDHE